MVVQVQGLVFPNMLWIYPDELASYVCFFKFVALKVFKL